MHKTLTACALIASASMPIGFAETDGLSDVALIDFSAAEEARLWRIVNDNVMGGRSLGTAGLVDGTVLFEGATNTNGGGFASIRRSMAPSAISATSDAFLVSAKQDGRTYSLTARTEQRYRGRYVSYQAIIPPAEPGDWATLEIPFSAFVPTVFGRRVTAPDFEPSKITQIGIIINDGLDGPFQLQVRSIKLHQVKPNVS
jgi:NADH dehydrogenase [ubiquinone] 1 alpha subcomplex assembly factor 1